ncbi:MAG: LuxR C-terminal-related transcriptional regulator [Actinomycetes bacterium]
MHTEDGGVVGVSRTEVLERARQAYARQAWRESHDQFTVALAQSPLSADDLERLARTASLLGDDEQYVRLLGQASQLWAHESNLARAAECACYLAMNLSFRGQWAPAAGWLTRAQQQLDAAGADCPARALILGMNAVQTLSSGDAAQAKVLFDQALAIARRCGDPSITALTGLGVGQSLIAMGKAGEGLSRLDEVMVSVITDDLNPIVTGIIYCAVIESCHDGYDARRAGEWTSALTQWCDAQPQLVPFRGQCLVHRAQILQLRGSWPDAMAQIGDACARLSQPPGHPGVGAAYYEQAELHRLRGELSQAEQTYEKAGGFGQETQPGMALLRLAQGRLEQARNGIARALQETAGTARPRLLAAGVEVALAAGDLAAGRAHAEELTGIATSYDSLLLSAMAAQASGSVLVAAGQAGEALPVLRRAWNAWHELDAPYYAARVRTLVGRACRELGDIDAARMEFEAARSTFEHLGAQPDLHQLHGWSSAEAVATQHPAGLTGREVQVLREVASGKTNRAIATELFLSEKTVARHLSNIFTKLGVASRAAATAYAYEHDLV